MQRIRSRYSVARLPEEPVVPFNWGSALFLVVLYAYVVWGLCSNYGGL